MSLLKRINDRLYELERRKTPLRKEPLPQARAERAVKKDIEKQMADTQSDAVTKEAAEAQAQPGFVGSVKEVVREFMDDDGMTQAAALAFYTGLSLAPLLTIAVWATQVFLGSDSKENLIGVFQQVLGSQAAAPIGELLQPATEQAKQSMTISGITSLILFAVTASGVFAQLQSSLNLMWNVEPDPKKAGIWLFLRKRLFSLGMLLTILFLLMVSMILSVGIEAVFGDYQSEHKMIATGINLSVTLVAATGVFALMFAYLPDARVPWRDTIVGAAITAGLFLVGRWGLAVYLGRGGYETSYGAAVGSFVALLVWVYYTSIIIFIGTEATQVYARRHDHKVKPEEHAVKTKRIKQEIATA
jgi:membrane protein